MTSTLITTLSLHDALPILARENGNASLGTKCSTILRRGSAKRLSRIAKTRSCITSGGRAKMDSRKEFWRRGEDRKSTRLNSSHANNSYAFFWLKKKKQLLR